MNWNKIYFMASKQFYFIILLLMLSSSLICYCDENSDEVIPLTFGDKQYKLYPLKTKTAQTALDLYWANEKNNPFYLHLSAMPITNKSKNTSGWYVHRSDTKEYFFDNNMMSRVCGVMWQRNEKKQHLIYHTITSPIGAFDEDVKVERIGAQIAVKYLDKIENNESNTPTEITNNSDLSKYTRYYNEKKDYVAIPTNKLHSVNKTHFICNADNSIEFRLYNVDVYVESNFTELDRDVKEALVKSTTLLEVAIAISEYIRKPFPPPKRIKKLVSRYYFDRFKLAKEVVLVGEEVKLDIAYTIEATRCPEWIRLRATEGEFRRDKNDVYYKATKPGKQTIYLEAISGTGANGSPIYDVSFAEQRKIDIVVITGKESNADIDRIAGYRSWMALTGQFPVTAKFISIDDIDNIEPAEIN
ncbi:MAG: hypothetical protein LBT09_06115, partial [Planctomycetaceae bacterium]|nr:hypothetical protein [Planctomycetaceae bacterium]